MLDLEQVRLQARFDDVKRTSDDGTTHASESAFVVLHQDIIECLHRKKCSPACYEVLPWLCWENAILGGTRYRLWWCIGHGSKLLVGFV